jgi:TRAP-type C4-dicarboxylate transport system permease small subunit
LLLALMTAASAVSNILTGRPFAADHELVKHVIAIAIFMFLPYCQMTGANVTVDIFTENMSERGKQAMAAFSSLFAIALSILLLVQMTSGFRSYLKYPEVTPVLKLPLVDGVSADPVFACAAAWRGAFDAGLQACAHTSRRCRPAAGELSASMDHFLIGLAGLGGLLFLIAIRVPIAYTMILIGIALACRGSPAHGSCSTS